MVIMIKLTEIGSGLQSPLCLSPPSCRCNLKKCTKRLEMAHYPHLSSLLVICERQKLRHKVCQVRCLGTIWWSNLSLLPPRASSQYTAATLYFIGTRLETLPLGAINQLGFSCFQITPSDASINSVLWQCSCFFSSDQCLAAWYD